MNLAPWLEITRAIAIAAGDLLRIGYYSEKRIDRKSSAIDLVTQFDEAAEKLIKEKLQIHFPTHSIVAEEGGKTAGSESDYVWYVDPLDGTNNFAHGIPIFAVSIALYHQGKPLLGVVHEPLRQETFYASAGNGAFLHYPTGERKLQVSPTEKLIGSILATGFPYDRHKTGWNNSEQTAVFLQQIQGFRRLGAAAIDLAYVAAGRLDGYWEYKLKDWDVAAGLLLVQEAGGIVTTPTGQPLTVGQGTLSVVASNPLVHPQMIASLARCTPPKE